MKINIFVTVTILILGLVVGTIWLFNPLLNPEKMYYDLFENGFTILDNRQVQPKPLNETYKENTAKYYIRSEIIITDYNLLNPVIASVEQNKNIELGLTVNQLILKREFNSFAVQKRTVFFTQNKTFQEALEIAKKYDLSKENPDPVNITVNPAPTREEVELSKQRDIVNNNPERIKRKEKCDQLFDQTNDLYNQSKILTPEITKLANEATQCRADIEKDFPVTIGK